MNQNTLEILKVILSKIEGFLLIKAPNTPTDYDFEITVGNIELLVEIYGVVQNKHNEYSFDGVNLHPLFKEKDKRFSFDEINLNDPMIKEPGHGTEPFEWDKLDEINKMLQTIKEL